ncbi:MAG: ABC transporter family substrate-binding protein [Egibacteraceae bacterium]
MGHEAASAKAGVTPQLGEVAFSPEELTKRYGYRIGMGEEPNILGSHRSPVQRAFNQALAVLCWLPPCTPRMGETMKRSPRRSVALVALLGLAVWVSACSSGTSTTELSGETPSAAQNDINPVPRDQLEDGGTLRWPLTTLPANFNLYHLDGLRGDTAAVVVALMPAVFVIDAAGQPTLRTEYVESAELTATTPKQVVTYRINPQATWSDGTPITAADFEAQWRALNGSDPRFNSGVPNYDSIESVTRGRDDGEVVVTFKEPFADWQILFTPLYPASTNTNPDIFNGGWRDRPLVTAGPFQFQSLDQTAQTITLVRDEDWWGRRARLDRIVYRIISPDAQVDALANGEVDFIDIGANVDALQRAAGMPSVTIRRARGRGFDHITFNGASAALEDVRVRQALAMSIDRGRIAQALVGPLGVPTVPLGNHLLMATQRGYQDNSGDIGAYDPARARALLDEAGWGLDGGVRAKDGNEIALRYVISAQDTIDQRIAELVQGMLGEVGVKVEIQAVPSAALIDDYVAPGNFDLTTFSWSVGPFPVSSSEHIYTSPRPGPGGQPDIQFNFARVSSAELDRLFDRASSELDRARMLQMTNEIDAMIWREVHSLPLYQRPDIVASRSDLASYGAFGFASIIYEDIGFTPALTPLRALE